MTAARSIPNFRSPLRFAALVVAFFAFTAPLQAADDSAATALFNKYCVSCHGEDAKPARVRLDQLKPNFAEPQPFANWVKVLDLVSAGEMPPKRKEQPTTAERQALVNWLRPQLHAADLARVQSQGRVIYRRLNRTEYENTLHDLLAINKPLATYLPDDSTAGGFDNIGSALQISSQLMERYLEAADIALQAATVETPRPQFTKQTYSFVKEHGVEVQLAKPSDSRMFAVKDDIYYMFSDYIPYGGGKLGQFHAPETGRYRFRIKCWGHNGPVTMRVYGGSTHEYPNHLIGHFDLPANQPTTIEFEDEFPKGSTIEILPYKLPLGGFVNAGEKLMKRLGLALQTAEVEGPITAEWPPASYRWLYGDLDLKKGTLADAEKILKAFVPRAYRRPVSDAEVQPFIDLVKSRLDEKLDFRQSIRLGLQAVLCSPHFLFLEEKPGKLDDYALAARLSYFLWSSTPDEKLLALARDKALSQPKILYEQVERMLADPMAQRFTQNFLNQWLDLKNIDATTPDKTLYPEHDELLQVSMLAETRAFFDELLKKDLSVTNFLDSSFSMLNSRLARQYGIAGVEGQQIRRVELPAGSHRGGLLTQASILKVTANGTTTSPVVRGVWVMKNILGTPVPPPPPDVPAIEPDIRGAKTIREQLDKHKQIASCATCHRKMDPLGFALENYDVIGGWREKYRSLETGEPVRGNVQGVSVKYKIGLPVDAGDALPDGRKFSNIDELKKLLLTDREQIARCVAGKLLTYGTGGSLQFSDRQMIDEIVARSRAHDLGLRTILHEVVQSPAFLNK
jgi:mono/diheme cytochrome c family protein